MKVEKNTLFFRLKKMLYGSHTSIEANKKFKLYYRLSFLLVLIFFICASACWTYSGTNLKLIDNPWLITGYTFGFIFFIIGVLLGIFFGWIVAMAYQESKIEYFNSDEYKKTKTKYMNKNLNKENKKYVKSLYKLRFIDKIKYQQYIDSNKKK